MLFLPLITILLFLVAIGGNPKDLKIGIVNDEIESKRCENSILKVKRVDKTCQLSEISCSFISELNQSEQMDAIIIYYESLEKALKEARKGNIISILYFHQNFTKSFEGSFLNEIEDDNFIENSQIEVFMDKTNYQLTNFFIHNLFGVYKNFSANVMMLCGYKTKLGLLPMTFMQPIYGSFNSDFKSFMSPPMIIVIMFYIAACLNAFVFLDERLSGFWNRTLLSGVNVFELILSHFIVQTIVLVIQLFEIFFLTKLIFPLQEYDKMILIILIFNSVQFCGLFFGMCVSCLADNMLKVQFSLTGLAQSMLIISGEFSYFVKFKYIIIFAYL